MLLLGMLALFLVDYMQLVLPELYRMVINGVKTGIVEVDGVLHTFDLDFLLDKICLPLLFVILGLVFGRFLWRVCFFGSGIMLEADLRSRMFDRCKDLSQEYYQVNKVGNLMSFFTETMILKYLYGAVPTTILQMINLRFLDLWKQELPNHITSMM